MLKTTEMSFQPILLTREEQIKEEKEAKDLVSLLLKETETENNSKTKHTRRIENTVAGTNIPILSWRFNEWDYYNKKLELPTNARGLFTTTDGKIICRGYDKFFNLNEMSSVNEELLSNSTKGPYTVTVKSNGCIVFISSLEDGTLVVCSKHSTGFRSDLSKNHAMVAQEALELQLKNMGISPNELGKLLYNYKITAVCEYCNDEFEEHVLEYKENKAGLYLHGLNLNTVKFKTYPMEKVNQFAKMFGFKETKYLTFNSFDETLNFMNECNKTGSFQNEEIEGFVVRCFKKLENNKYIDYFFKFKFEEPYLLYRELREITKQFINQGPENLKFGKHKLICMDYLKFVMPYLISDENLKNDYLDNKGIISLRKKYFESKNSTSMQLINNELGILDLEEEMKSLKFGKTKPNRYVLVTVATIGCGKTTTSNGLSYLYPDLVGHVQNDNIQKPGKTGLINAALELLNTKPIVIMDKNNHKMVERKAIFDGFDKLNTTIPKSKLKFICLNFLPKSPKHNNEFWELTKTRVINRGDSHQSIQIKDGVTHVENIMRGFISRFQNVNPNVEPDSKFDYIIDLNVTDKDSSLINMKTIVNFLRGYIKDIELQKPSDEEYVEAFKKAQAYKPTFVKQMSKSKPKAVYFAIDISDTTKILKLVDSQSIDFFNRLKEVNRIQKYFHVTLIHKMMRKSNDTNRKIWDLYESTFKLDIGKYTVNTIPENKRCALSSDYTADVELLRIVWDSKVMCIEVKILQITYKGEKTELHGANTYSHITIGTIDKTFPPSLSGVMLAHLHKNDESIKEKEKINARELPERIKLSKLPLYVFMD